MSIESKATITCPTCNESFETKYRESLNAQLNPVEKEQLISGELFYTVCTKCNSRHSFDYPMLYHDMENKVMIQLSPDAEDNEEYIKKHFEARNMLDKELPGTVSMQDGYRFRVVNNVNDLREKAMLFSSSLDDRVNELVKAFYRTRFAETNPEITVKEILFYRDAPNKLVILSEDKNTYTVEYNMGLYNQLTKTFKSQIEEKSNGCYLIDQALALSVLLNEKMLNSESINGSSVVL